MAVAGAHEIVVAIVRLPSWEHSILETTSNTNWESHRSCVLKPSKSNHIMAFQELLKVHNGKHVEQNAFDGRVSHRGFPVCVDCIAKLQGRDFLFNSSETMHTR
jgi:hypothetical protein